MEIADLKAPEPVDGVPPWQDPDWLAEADAWISARCAEAGLVRAGPAQLRCRPWSVVARVPAAGPQTVWFKANAPGAAFEPALLDALGRWAPDMALPLVAVDRDRAWSLTRDGGRTLADVTAAAGRPAGLRHWHAPLRRYAALQHSLAQRASELLALGLPDMRPGTLTAQLDRVLSGPAASVLASRGEDTAIRALIPRLRSWCGELDAIGIPATLDHEDLHAGNIFFGSGGPGGPGGAIPFDWGDAGLGHPFGSMLTTLRSVALDLGVARDDPALDGLLPVYLEPWAADGFPAADLRRAVRLALRVTPIARALTWGRVFPCFALSSQPLENAAAWLGRLLADDPSVVTDG